MIWGAKAAPVVPCRINLRSVPGLLPWDVLRLLSLKPFIRPEGGGGGREGGRRRGIGAGLVRHLGAPFSQLFAHMLQTSGSTFFQLTGTNFFSTLIPHNKLPSKPHVQQSKFLTNYGADVTDSKRTGCSWKPWGGAWEPWGPRHASTCWT